MSRVTGGPAFPVMDSQTVHRIGVAACEDLTDPEAKDKAYLAATMQAASGMALRDHFAGQALQGWLAGGAPETAPVIAAAAYAMADAMLRERAK